MKGRFGLDKDGPGPGKSGGAIGQLGGVTEQIGGGFHWVGAKLREVGGEFGSLAENFVHSAGMLATLAGMLNPWRTERTPSAAGALGRSRICGAAQWSGNRDCRADRHRKHASPQSPSDGWACAE